MIQSHIERIICPNCRSVCLARVEHTQPFYSYVHECQRCKYMITESVWEREPPCLSVRQPWAWLLANGFKNIENRDWATKVRGPFKIHAALGMTLGDYQACKLFVAGFAPIVADLMPGRLNLMRGGIVGEAVILDCVSKHASEWFTGSFGFVIGEAYSVPFRPCKGRLGFFYEEAA